MEKEYIAVSSGQWERRGSVEDAITALRRRMYGTNKRRVVVYEVPPCTQVSDMGTFVFFPPEGKNWADLPPKYGHAEEVSDVEVYSLRVEITERLLTHAKKTGTPYEMLEDLFEHLELEALESFAEYHY